MRPKDRCEGTVWGGAPQTGSWDVQRNKIPFVRLPQPHSPRRGADAECDACRPSTSYNACLREIGCKLLAGASGRSDFHLYENPPYARLCCALTGTYYRVVAPSTAVQLSDDEKLEALRRLDQFRHWHSLDEKRYCLVCGNLIMGGQIQVAGGTRSNGPLRLNCPTERCNSIPMDWVLPTDEILARAEKLAEEKRKASAPKPTGVTIRNGRTVRTEKSHEHFVSRLCRLAFHLKGHAKAVPSNPCGP